MIRPRVLLADDHRALLEAETALLSPYFDVVGTVVDGAALVLAARRLLPDVIVTDISMPILNGIHAANKLRASGSTAKIPFLTIHGERELVEACMEAGAYADAPRAQLQSRKPRRSRCLAQNTFGKECRATGEIPSTERSRDNTFSSF